jgi:Fe-S cluster assembly iron-binding protein IscA
MSANSDKLLELVLEEMKKNNDKLENVNHCISNLKEDINTKFSNINGQLSDVKTDIMKVITRVELLDELLEDTKKDVEHLEYTVKGNGTPGIKTKLEILELEKNQLEEKFVELKNDMKSFNVEEKKENTAIKVAIIGGAISGFVALIKGFF